MAEQAVFSFISETIGELVSQEAKFLLGVGDQVGILQQRLKQMNWFLRDADENQEKNKRVLEWVLQARDLAYEAEDLIETYAFKVTSRSRGGVAGKIKRFACLFNEVDLRHQLGSDIENLLKKISDMTVNLNEYGIKSVMENKDGSSSNDGGGSSSSGGLLLRRTYSVAPAENIFVGVDKDVDKLADILAGDVYAVVGLRGMGGIGKTTLARKVYHHPKVRSHFEGFVWVCISQQWNKKDILCGILIKLMPEKRESIEKWRDAEIVRELSQFLQNKQCLVVLDDMWKVDAWESIKHEFPMGLRGSKVLITTRNLDVFTQIDANGFLHEPRVLSTDESWELICKKGVLRRYIDQDPQEYRKFEELGKDMVTRCGGLPLAVVILGGILASKGNYSEWVKVHRHIKSFVGNGKGSGIDEGKISQVLALSYDELPFKLKPCFLYLSRYAEDEDIELESLYQIWMAEGMISAEDRLKDETMMEVAERYVGELAERCMVFVEKEDLMSFLPLKSCRLHDLMREFCLLKAREENFLELAVDRQETSALSGTTFRLAINLLDGIHAESFIQPTDAVSQRLRSFSLGLRDYSTLVSVEKMKVQFGKFMLLRVLCLEGCDLQVASYLKSICTLVHLRYLSLRRSKFGSVPSSIRSLIHLHTLDLRRKARGYVVSISSGIESLEQLKHLYLPKYFTCNDGKGRKLGLERLRKLEILKNFDCCECDAKYLSALTNLRSFSATVRDNESLKVFVSQVCNLSYLRFLLLDLLTCVFSSEEELAVLRGLFSLNGPTALYLRDCRIDRLPVYEAGFCKNLHTLSLFYADRDEVPSLVEDPFSTLEKFPNLINLTLSHCYGGREMITHAYGFPKLRSLCFDRMDNLENLIIEDGAMPHLSHLGIQECRNLRSFSAEVYGNESLKVLVSQVCNLSSLRFLSLDLWSCDFLSEEELAVLRGVFSLNCLTALKIEGGRIDRLPAYEAGFCKNLHTLTLAFTLLVEDPFSTLEKFPNLINLNLHDCYGVRDMYTHADGFPKLRSLSLSGMNNLENWIIEDGAMPHLSHLQIESCTKLKTVPEGVRFLTSLKELILLQMGDEFNSGVQVKDNEEGADFGIVRHIPSIQVMDNMEVEDFLNSIRFRLGYGGF